MKRRHQQKKRTARLLERMEAVNELDEVFSLAELSALSVSNPINRRNELMTRLDGVLPLLSKAKKHGEG